MQNFTNVPPQNSQFPNPRSGPAFTSPEQDRSEQYSQLQGATQPNLYQQRGLGFTSPPQDRRRTLIYSDDPRLVAFTAQPVAYSSERFPIQTRHEIPQAMVSPATMEPQSTYAQFPFSDQSLYHRRALTNEHESSQLSLPRPVPTSSAQINIKLPPELFLLVTQSNIQTTISGFNVDQTNHQNLKKIVEANFIENSKRVFIEFFNDKSKSTQEIATNFDLLSNSLQQFYTSRRSSNTSAIQAARNFSSPESQAIPNADSKANDYLKLRLTVMIESLSQIDDEQTYNKIKQGLSRLIEVNHEINLDQKYNNLLTLTYQDSRSSSSLSSPASIQSLTQAKESKGILRQDSAKRIEELERQNQENVTTLNASQNLWLAESRKLQEANKKIEELTTFKNQYEQTIYQLTTLLSSYERNSARLNFLAQQEIEIESAKVDIAKLESQKQELEAQLNDASQTNQIEKDQLNQRLQENQTEIESHQRKISELQSLTAKGKEGIELMNREISEIQELLSSNLQEFQDEEAKYVSKLQKYHQNSDKIIAEKTVENIVINESNQDLENQLSQLKRTLEISQSLIDQQKSALKSDEEAISRSHNALAQSEREKRSLAERLDKSENARKNLTGEKAVEDWLSPSEQHQRELTSADIENFLKWAPTSEGDQKNSTSQQGTQTTDLPTLQLSERIQEIATRQVRSALFVAEVVNDLREKISSSQQASLQPDSLQTASSQRPSSPSASPQPDQGQSRLKMEVANSLMST